MDADFCERCYAEVVGAACCPDCAPLYQVYCYWSSALYETRNLRRAWEALTYYRQHGYREASIIVPDRLDLDFDGLSERETELLDEWTVFDGMKLARFHLCLMPEAA